MKSKSILTQEARRRQSAVKLSQKKGKTYAARIFGVSRSSVKRWNRRYDGSWQSLLEGSHRPKSHPNQQTAEEEKAIRIAYEAKFFRYGWDGVYDELVDKHGYGRSWGGMYHAARRMGLAGEIKKKGTRQFRKYPEIAVPGEKVQIDVKVVPCNCLRGKIKTDGKRLYQWTAIDECTRLRFVYGFDEHTPENTVKFFKMLRKAFPFEIQTVQTDNGTEFTYRFISETKECPFDTYLNELKIVHKLIPPRTPWHNGKVERSHRNDQRYFYDWETFGSLEELNRKLLKHMEWSNNKRMRTLGGISPTQKLRAIMEAA